MKVSLTLFLLALVACNGLMAPRTLPEKVIAGYSSRCDGSVIRAVEHGVNVVIWSFFHVVPRVEMDVRVGVRGRQLQNKVIETPLDLECVRREIEYLNGLYGDGVVHLASFGGWNARHLDGNYSSDEIYNAWKEFAGDIFDGIDWDLEGNDDLESPYNIFSIDCLDRMGEISELAKKGKCYLNVCNAFSSNGCSNLNSIHSQMDTLSVWLLRSRILIRVRFVSVAT